VWRIAAIGGWAAADTHRPQMELAGVLSNQELGGRLRQIGQAVAALPPGLAPEAAEAPPAQGEVLRTIKTVLADVPDGLRSVEIWRLVVARLGRPVLYATVKAGLAQNAGDDGCFGRLRRGVYRLK